MRTLRSRVAVFLLIGNGLVFAVAGWSLRTTVFHWLQAEFDRALLAKANALVTLTKEEEGEVELDFADEFMPEFEAEISPEYFQIWIRGEGILERSRSLGRENLPRIEAVANEPRFRELVLADERPGRAVQVDYGVQREEPENDDFGFLRPTQIHEDSGQSLATLVVARSVEDLCALESAFDFYLVAGSVVLMTLLGILVWSALKWGLRPLDSIASQVEKLDAESLDAQIDLHDPPLELVPIVDQLNALLLRLQSSFARERQLSSDMAHELRTPITELRTLSEVSLAGDLSDEQAEFYEDAREIALQMERIVVQLLQLARSEGGIEAFEASPVELAPLIEAAWMRQQEKVERRSLELRLEGDRSLALSTDCDRLDLIICNLVNNALTHSPEGSEVTCRLIRTNGNVSMCLANRAPDLEAGDLDKVFDRFWRKERARSGGLHAGLGLALARAIALQIGVELNVSLEDEVFEVSLLGPATM